MAIFPLSIPFTWDFSMHPKQPIYTTAVAQVLSIPFTWDFSMHPLTNVLFAVIEVTLSIPFTWDFSMHPTPFLAPFANYGYLLHDLRYVFSIIIET